MSIEIPAPIAWAAQGRAKRQRLLQRPAMTQTPDLLEQTGAIIAAVRERGDAALRELTRRFDDVALEQIEVPAADLEAAAARLAPDIQVAIQSAMANIEAFHAAQHTPQLRVETSPGVVCERQTRPLDAVGLYVPAGSAPLPSTVMMLAIPARLASCPLRILCSPPGPDGRVDQTVLATAQLCGVDRVFGIGGAQAIAAMAYGTASVPRVAKIFGPGNAWVTAAKTLVAQDATGAACDLPAGPSEVMVIADGRADASFVASDLLSQAEHGADSQALLVTDCMDLAHRVAEELRRQTPALTRCDIAIRALAQSALIVTTDIEEAVQIANDYAPEHLILNVGEPRELLPRIRNAGSVFLGALTPESVGDYCSGTNHVLPTYGWARSHSGLGVADFQRSMSVQELSADGLENIGPVASRLAALEGLDAHARAVELRLQRLRRGAVA